MKRSIVMLGLLVLAGCSGRDEPIPQRDPKPVQETVTIKVPGMT